MAIDRSILQTFFNGVVEKLDAQQRRAITNDRAVMVTGTPAAGIQILLAKIGQLLLHTGARPENILCFTSCDAEATELRSRLLQGMGADIPLINIYTFPAFCKEIIQDNLSIFEAYNRPVISNFKNTQVLKKLVDNFPKDHPLKKYRGDVYFEVRHLNDLFSLMKLQGWTAEFINQKIDEYLEGLLQPSNIPEEKEKMERLRAGVNELEIYHQLLRDKNRCHYHDLESIVVRVLEENSGALAAYQCKFKHILVTDLQTTNCIRSKLLQLLTSNLEGTSIFRLSYTGDEAHTVGQLIDQLNFEPVITEYNTVNEEMVGITEQVHHLLQQGVPPGKIGIIFKEESYGTKLANHLRIKSIPIHRKSSINIPQNAFTKKIIHILRYLDTENHFPWGGDDLLFEILHFEFYQVPAEEIVKLTVEANSKRYTGMQSSMRKLLADKTSMLPRDLFDKGLHTALKEFSNTFEKLIGDIPGISLPDLFENVTNQAGIRSYINRHPQQIELTQFLTALFDLIKEVNSHNPLLTLSDFIEIVDLMEKERMPLEQVLVSGSDKDVYLLSAKNCNGLEFDHIFFAGLHHCPVEEKCTPAGGYILPPNLLYSQSRLNEDETRKRLFYLALTRNSAHFYISFARRTNDGKEMEPSTFISQVFGNHLAAKKISLSREQLKEYEPLNFIAVQPQIQRAEEHLVRPLLDKFIMSITALNTYLNCPLAFYYQNLIRVPCGKNEATTFGSAIHFALEKLFRNMQVGKQEQFAPASDFLKYFNWYMHQNRNCFTREAFGRRLQYGEEVLQKYYDNNISSWKKIVSVELNIRGVVINGVPIRGKIDKLEFDGRQVNVVDYKSGDIEKGLIKMNPPCETDPNGGDYWRQAVFYKILVDNYTQKSWQVVSTEFDFIEPDKTKVYRKEKINIRPEDMETVKQQLTAVWAKIQAREFYTGCNKEHCHWCNFVKNNEPALALLPVQAIPVPVD